MRLFDRVACMLNQSTFDEYIRRFMSGDDDVGDDNDIVVTQETALRFSAVFGCCRVLAETFASVPVLEYKRLKGGDRDRTFETSAYDLLHSAPNDEMSPYHFAEMGMYQLNTGGNFVSFIRRTKGGDLHSFVPFLHQVVQIERTKPGGGLVYRIDQGGVAEKKSYDRKQVFHIPGPSLNGVTGMSPISYAAEAIRLGMTYEKFGINYFKNGAAPSGIFKHPGKLKDEALKRLQKSLEGNYRSFLTKGRPILAEDGLDYVPFQLNMVDSQLLESKKFQIEDICRVYRVPMHMVQNLDRATNNNIEHQSLEFSMYSMLPWFKRWESCANAQLLTRQERKAGFYLEYNMAALLRGDSKSMADAFARGRQWGWLSVNDIRRLLNMNRIENGDVYLQPVNMVEAGGDQADNQLKKLTDEVHSLIEARRQ